MIEKFSVVFAFLAVFVVGSNAIAQNNRRVQPSIGREMGGAISHQPNSSEPNASEVKQKGGTSDVRAKTGRAPVTLKASSEYYIANTSRLIKGDVQKDSQLHQGQLQQLKAQQNIRARPCKTC